MMHVVVWTFRDTVGIVLLLLAGLFLFGVFMWHAFIQDWWRAAVLRWKRWRGPRVGDRIRILRTDEEFVGRYGRVLTCLSGSVNVQLDGIPHTLNFTLYEVEIVYP